MLYGLTQSLGAYGLLAVFAAGFTFRRYEYEHEVHHAMHRGTDAAGKILELLVLLMLGSMLTISGLRAPGIGGWLLAPVLLLVIRPALVLATTNPRLMSMRSRIFLGFFGVRGVAAIFYATVVNSRALPVAEQHIVVWTTIACVITSIVIHGLSATPLTNKLIDPEPHGKAAVVAREGRPQSPG